MLHVAMVHAGNAVAMATGPQYGCRTCLLHIESLEYVMNWAHAVCTYPQVSEIVTQAYTEP
jgi:hypothetical protein